MTFDIQKVSILRKDSIHCGFHLVPYIVQTVLETLPSSTYALITDSNIASLHLTKFKDEFDAQIAQKKISARFIPHVIAPGEGSKSRETKAEIEDFLLQKACTRDTVILAVGGGVIGDLVGFVAATFMRGVRFVQVPTTLLAMVDSSVGGKTAIDTPHGKNLIGAFWQPEYIFIDAAFLETLPTREFSNGMAEVVKTAAIWNEEEFAALESHSSEIFAAIQAPSVNSAGRDLATRSEAQNLLLKVIVGSISVKAHIVTIDERETGLRNLVNFGHTIGHAIEAVLTPQILHGECVSIGMILEAEISRQMGILSQVGVGRLTRCLKSYNLPVSMNDPRISKLPTAKLLTPDRLLDIMKVDKKNSGPAKKIVLLSRIGATYEPKATVVPDNLIRKALSEAVKVVSGSPKHSPISMATPGSKSISNRALVLAALGSGTCRLTNLLHSDDTQVMMTALLELQGAKFSWEDGGETLVVEGGGGKLSPPSTNKEIYLGNAGTAARFLTSVCALARSEGGAQHTVITGNARMKQRPVGPLVDALRANGTNITYKEAEGSLPLAIPASSTGFKGGEIQLAASVSSQYVSSILLCAPYANEPVVLELTGGQVISQPYIDMTIAMMETFGIKVTRRKDEASGNLLDVYDIPTGKYQNPSVYTIESDASSATYPLAIAAITGTTCTLTNIGSASLQGDAGFAKAVLEPMGCKVEQTKESTTVTGPPVGQLRAIGLVDMEPMTDAFLTASVLAAVARQEVDPARKLEDGSPLTTTRILGIANQRVKECNRIRAMIDQLAKFGVKTKELDDGLEIYGMDPQSIKSGTSIHCYDDHRVAMAFSVLGSLIPETILEEKRCVEKTWPNWWDDLENKIGLGVVGVEFANNAAASASSSTLPDVSYDSKDPNASVLLIGMRGSGKTFIGKIAAAELEWNYLDADQFLEAAHQMTCKEFVHTRGWEAFRVAETAALSEILKLHPTRTVISLGGGIVETESARDAIREYARSRGIVVHISRDIEQIVQYLTHETERPAYPQDIEDVFRRREPWFEDCCSHKFVSIIGPDTNLPSATSVASAPSPITAEAGSNSDPNANNAAKGIVEAPTSISTSTPISTSTSDAEGAAAQRHLSRIKNQVGTFFRHITKIAPNLAANLVAGGSRRSYFLSLTFPNIITQAPLLDEETSDIITGIDAVELRVDLLVPQPERSKAIKGTATGTIALPTSSADNIQNLLNNEWKQYKEYVSHQLAYLKYISTLPVVYTVRTVSQGGAFPDDPKFQDKLFELLDLGLQLGAEYIDIEITSSHSKIQSLSARKGASQILASYHDWSGNLKWSGPEIERQYSIASTLGDIVKIVGKANTIGDNTDLFNFVRKKSISISKGDKMPNLFSDPKSSPNPFADTNTNPKKPFIAINLGTEGQLSRILNPTFSPVTHPQLPIAAAPGQLSFAQIQTGLHLLGQLPRKKYFLFGTPISSSPSPTLHNTGFEVLGLPHLYSLHETVNVDDSIRKLIREPDFGGASVTIPHKRAIMNELDELSPAAKLIGAVNTILPITVTGADGERRIVLTGDNTDWIGIRNAILAKTPISLDLSNGKSGKSGECGIVIGAGGTARAAIFALHELGLGTIYIWNRTSSTAQALVKDFPAEYNVQVLVSLEALATSPPSVIVGTVPAHAISKGSKESQEPLKSRENEEGGKERGLELSEVLFSRKTGGVVVEMAYRPRVTPLVELVQKLTGSESNSNTEPPTTSESKWSIVYGVDVLLEQGYQQFELWTHRQAPKRAIKERVMAMYAKPATDAGAKSTLKLTPASGA